MSAITNTMLGIGFLVIGSAATFLMYYLWGFPFDHATLQSAAPPRLMRLHRILGYSYAVIYVILMFQMVPRLWQYQIEFAPRTVLHMVFGMTIGVLLVLKILIVRFFKHLEGPLVPFLGTSVLVCTFLLLGLSVPFSLRALYLERHAPGGSAFGEESLRRVSGLLRVARLPGDAPPADLATAAGLHLGQSLMMTRCTQCHDLRTVLARPRTPTEWSSIVQRMSERSSNFQPITPWDQQHVIAYLVAVSPDLRQAASDQRANEESHRVAKQNARNLNTNAPATNGLNLEQSKLVFESSCAQCHALGLVGKHPPGTAHEAETLVARMVDNGLEASEGDLRQIIFYLKTKYAK